MARDDGQRGDGRDSDEGRREGRPDEGQDFGGSGWPGAHEGWAGRREMRGGSWGGGCYNAGFGRDREDLAGHSSWGDDRSPEPGESDTTLRDRQWNAEIRDERTRRVQRVDPPAPG